MSDWDLRFLDLAAFIANWSKDSSTRVGCVVVRPDRTVAGVGFNGFPRGVKDDPQRYEDRETKLAMVVHAEANAVLTAHERLHGCTAYSSVHPCSTCSGLLIQAGIVRVVTRFPTARQIERWGESFDRSRVMLEEAGVALELFS